LLVDGFPESGPGSEDHYEIYGNFLFHNPRESLIQVSGRVSIHDNILVDAAWAAITLTDHNTVLKRAYVYNNTIYQTGGGIQFSSSASEGDAVVGNLVFGDAPIAGSISDQRDNLTAPTTSAAGFVTLPSLELGKMDFFPLPQACEGPALDLSKFARDVDYDRDFNGQSKGALTFRGAYAGSGENPGWQLAAANKPATGPGSSSGSAAGGSTSGVGSTGAGGGATSNDPSSPEGDVGASGCASCQSGGAAPTDFAALVLALLGWSAQRRSDRDVARRSAAARTRIRRRSLDRDTQQAADAAYRRERRS
jgi:hypothetical protein